MPLNPRRKINQELDDTTGLLLVACVYASRKCFYSSHILFFVLSQKFSFSVSLSSTWIPRTDKKEEHVCVWAQTLLLVLLYVFKYIRKKEKVLFVLLKTRCDARAVNTLLSCFFLGDGLAARDADR